MDFGLEDSLGYVLYSYHPREGPIGALLVFLPTKDQKRRYSLSVADITMRYRPRPATCLGS